MTSPHRLQIRGRKIAMTAQEMDTFLTAERTCRVATVGPDGPHATPLWFCWHAGMMWLYSITRSQRWADLQRDPRIGIVVDAGDDYSELRGVEIIGSVEVVGELPRTGEPVEELGPIELLFAQKYHDVAEMVHDGRHAWLKVIPSKIVSWDFRKISPSGR